MSDTALSHHHNSVISINRKLKHKLQKKIKQH